MNRYKKKRYLKKEVFRIHKKASLQLSISAIVILILAITMLGLGLAFIRNLFSSGEEQFMKASATLEKQMYDQMKQSGKIIDINRASIKLKAPEKQQIWLGFMNQNDVEKNFKVESATIGSIGNNNCNPLGIDTLSNIKVSPNDVFVSPVNVESPAGMEKGTCVAGINVCFITISSGDATVCDLNDAQTKTIQLNVEIV